MIEIVKAKKKNMSGSGQRARALNTPASILFFPIIFAFPFLIYNSPSINTVCKASGKI